jgi:hypothetical protein
MNQTDLAKSPEAQRIFKPDVLLIGIGAATAILIAYLLRLAEDSIPTDPPPIIIKDGSFVIETDEPLSEINGNPNIYKRVGFGEIKGVRVFKTNEITGQANSYDYDDRNGVEVDIRLQKHTSAGWMDINPLVTIRTISNAGNPKDFALTIGKKLNKKGKSKPPRKERRGDDDADTIRFGQIIVREDDGGGDPFVTADGDNYTIAFYNYLV